MVARIAKVYSVGAQLSLEENMACGVGACLGCTVQTVKGQKRVCTDGPVFYASELRKWL
jgi:dihydroorotate dehydrogenase electron transfer subunit